VGEPEGDGLGRVAVRFGTQAESKQSANAGARRDLTSPDTTIRGGVRLQRGPWEVKFRPERGGRITSIRLRGDELLDQGIGVDDPTATGFVAAGAAGWDEMVPNIDVSRYPGSGPYGGLELPDHGEAWRLPWSVIDETAMEVSGRLLPWKLARRIVLRDEAPRFE